MKKVVLMGMGGKADFVILWRKRDLRLKRRIDRSSL